MGMQRNRAKKGRESLRERRPLLSVAMIAKNEERALGRAIASVRSVAEVVVVDTGSTDRTRQVAQEHGARVYDFKWNHHFGEARSESIRRCRGQYVLWLDADETVMAEDLSLLQEAARAGQHSLISCLSYLDCSYQVPEYQVEGMGAVTILRVLRLARNVPGLRFVHRVHEQLQLPASVRDREPAASAIRVLHHGRMNPTKSTYYDALLILEHRDDPTDPHAAIYLAGRMVQANLPEALLELLDGCDLSRATARHQRERYWFFRAWALSTLGEQQDDPGRSHPLYQEALAAYAKARTPQADIMAAALLIQNGHTAEGVRILEEAHQQDREHLQVQRVLELAHTYQQDPSQLRQQLKAYFQALAQARHQAQQGQPATEASPALTTAPELQGGDADCLAPLPGPGPATAARRRPDLTNLRPRRGLVAPDFRGSKSPAGHLQQLPASP